MADIDWQDLHHSELGAAPLYALLALRCEVFVVEQACPYLDVDGRDLAQGTRHLLGWQQGRLAAYARLLPGEEVAIGRVVVAPFARGQQLGRTLMAQALAACARHWPQAAVVLSAQAHLQAFYRGFGFSPCSEVYDEDGIPHIDMRRTV
ncbi:GNAT family N-acetyltransferase [Nissabacter sp. SGAir0207]|uniref:GNAT family N-acetyltransferase n=1 Tax=Nissabacter sp. SGAir0207 TaxID=2126321 RepID=UPI0010CD3506|nr:GNAT family N-acetyltransferase [Nissabacter sp. SGAir0207]QCR36617.1 GNAT family N-acetyltransferase [Nissabacter sp. SGAir0207]